MAVVEAIMRVARSTFDLVNGVVERHGIHWSLVRMVTGICGTVPLACLQRVVPKGLPRHLYGACATAGLLSFVYGRDTYQFLGASALVYVLMRLFPKKCGHLTWATVFPYAIYIHYVTDSEAKWQNGEIDFTGSYMMLVLKLISIAMDYQDGCTQNKTTHSFDAMPTLAEFAGYVGAFGGVMVGPHYYYNDYTRYANNQGEYEQLNTKAFPNRWAAVVPAVSSACLCFAAFCTSSTFFPRKQFLFSAPLVEPFWSRVSYCFVSNIGYRTRFYFCWYVSETAYTLAGFGFSGYDKEGKPEWNRAINARFLQIEFADTMRTVLIKWNRNTGQWLRTYVYDRLASHDFRALLITQLISGVWHGLTMGYIVFFINTALLGQSSRLLYRVESKYCPAKWRPHMKAFHHFHTVFLINYVAGQYGAITADQALGWYKALCWVGHVEMLAVFVTCTAVTKLASRTPPAATEPAAAKKES